MGARLVVAGSRGSFAVPASAISDHHLDVTFPSRDDHVRLSGWLFRADHPTGRSVILVHGWQGEGGLTRYTHLPGLLAIPAIEASRVFGVLPTLSPVDVVRSVPDRAFLFLHASGDPLLGVANADQLYAVSSNRASQLVVMGGHDYMDTYTHNPGEYMTVLLSFIDRQLGHPAGA